MVSSRPSIKYLKISNYYDNNTTINHYEIPHLKGLGLKNIFGYTTLSLILWFSSQIESLQIKNDYQRSSRDWTIELQIC